MRVGVFFDHSLFYYFDQSIVLDAVQQQWPSQLFSILLHDHYYSQIHGHEVFRRIRMLTVGGHKGRKASRWMATKPKEPPEILTNLTEAI
jgi:hypothetical protein